MNAIKSRFTITAVTAGIILSASQSIAKEDIMAERLERAFVNMLS